MKIRTTGYVLLDGRSYAPDTELDVPVGRALQMVGDGQAEQIPEGGTMAQRNPGGGTGQHPPQAPVNADNYKPVFMDNVTTTSMNGLVTPVTPTYCLTRASAEQLATILRDLNPEIVMAWPYYVRAGVMVSSTVPWFRFPSGCAVNAGQESTYWINNSGASAEANCRKDIEAAQQQFYVEGSEQYPPQLQTPQS